MRPNTSLIKTHHPFSNSANQKKAFATLMESCNTEIDIALKLSSGIVKLVNPKWRTPDKMFCWGIIPYCETSYEGMMKVFYTLGEAFKMFVVDEDATHVRTLPNLNKHCINLCVDGLSLCNCRFLHLNLIKTLTNLTSAKFVLPLLECWSRFICIHDYFHETRLHCRDLIWRTYYGSFLQNF